MASDAIGALPNDSDGSDPGPTLEAIYLEQAGRLRGRLLGMTRDPAIAEDLASEAFVRLAIEIRAGRMPNDPAAWLHRVGANLAVSRGRRATVATRALPSLFQRDDVASPEDDVVTRERDLAVRRIVDSLAAPDRAIVVLAAQGYPPGEIAGMIGLSGAATRTRLCRARGRLRRRLVMDGIGA